MLSESELRRGTVVRAHLDPVSGSEQAGTRPVIILSPNTVNRKSPIVIIAPLTTKKLDRVYPFEVLLEPPEAGIPERSKIMPLHIRGVDKRRITSYYGEVSEETMRRIEEAVMLVTGMLDI